MPQQTNAVPPDPSHDVFTTAHHPVIMEMLAPLSSSYDFEGAALDLAARGLPVHPLTPHGKTPLLTHWARKATTDVATIRRWAEDYSDANVGIVTGPKSGVIVLDIDARHGGRRALEAMETLYGPLPLSPEVLTHDGRHLYFQHPEGAVRTGHLFPGIDIRGDSVNVVAPGSIHPGGSLYLWNPCLPPDMIPFAEAPGWLLTLLQTHGFWQPPKVQQVNLLAPRRASGPEEVLRDSGTQERRKVAGLLDGNRVAALFGEEWVVRRCLDVMGMRHVAIGRKFLCVLPGHEEEHASASIMRPSSPGQPFVYIDFHQRERERKGFPLPLVYVRLKTGAKGDTLPKPSFLVWSLRLLRDAGVIEPAAVSAPRIDPAAPESAKAAYVAFIELLGLKWLIKARAPSPFTWRFVMAWTGMGMRAVQKGMAWLLGRGYLRCVGQCRELAKKLSLFALGTRQFIGRRAARDEVDGGQEAIVEAVKPDMEAMYEENKHAPPKGTRQDTCPHEVEPFRFGSVTVCGTCYALLGWEEAKE